MTAHPPIFKEHGRTYQADSCMPLRRAVRQDRVRFNALARGHYPGKRLIRSAMPGLMSVGYWDATGPQNWGLDWHRNEGLELTFLETGALPFAVDGRPWPLAAGDLSITRPWQTHRVGDPHISAGRLYWVILDVGMRRPNQKWRWPEWLILDAKDLERLADLLRHNEQPVWPASPDVRHCFQQVDRILEGDSAVRAESHLAVCLNELLLALAEMLVARRIPLNPNLSSARRTVELFLRDLEENTDNLTLPWTVAQMAEQCGLGVTAFTQHCKQLTNLTPMQNLNKARVETAARLLKKDASLKVTEVALGCGFQSSQYFATVFRQFYGSSPRAYRIRERTHE